MQENPYEEEENEVDLWIWYPEEEEVVDFVIKEMCANGYPWSFDELKDKYRDRIVDWIKDIE